MKLLVSALFALIVVAAFTAFFFMSSLLAFVDSPEGLIASAKEEHVRQDVVRVTAEHIAAQVAADSTLEPMSVEELQAIVGTVISEQWLESSLRGAHAALSAAFHGAEDSAVMDLRATKSALHTALESLKVQASQSCKDLWGPELCQDQQASGVLVASFERRAQLAIDQIADEIDLMEGLAGPERQRVTRLKEGLESIHTVRMLALALLVMSLAIFIALGTRPVSTLLARAGLLASIASSLYLLTIAVGRRVVQDRLASGARDMSAAHDTSVQARELSIELVNQVIGSAMGGSTMPVALIGVVGLIVVCLVLLLSGRER